MALRSQFVRTQRQVNALAHGYFHQQPQEDTVYLLHHVNEAIVKRTPDEAYFNETQIRKADFRDDSCLFQLH